MSWVGIDLLLQKHLRKLSKKQILKSICKPKGNTIKAARTIIKIQMLKAFPILLNTCDTPEWNLFHAMTTAEESEVGQGETV